MAAAGTRAELLNRSFARGVATVPTVAHEKALRGKTDPTGTCTRHARFKMHLLQVGTLYSAGVRLPYPWCISASIARCESVPKV